jgi:hypothetical protein
MTPGAVSPARYRRSLAFDPRGSSAFYGRGFEIFVQVELKLREYIRSGFTSLVAPPFQRSHRFWGAGVGCCHFNAATIIQDASHDSVLRHDTELSEIITNSFAEKFGTTEV